MDAMDAKREAIRDGANPIERVDGEKLVRMFAKLELGVKPKIVYNVDLDFFNAFKYGLPFTSIPTNPTDPRISAITAGILAAIPEAQVRRLGSRAGGTSRPDSDMALMAIRREHPSSGQAS
jgi:hypothetical protein